MKRKFTRSRFWHLFSITTAFILTSIFQQKALASVLVVNSNLDSGPGTLRAQVLAAGPGDLIIFSGPMTINLSSQIYIDKGLTIDATTITGWTPSSNQVTIAGNGTVANAFYTTTTSQAVNLTIKGLIFNGFTGICITLMDAPNFLITNCWFGLLANGTSIASNSTGMCISVTKTSSYGNIGTGNPQERNIFFTGSATPSTCININGTGAGPNLVKIQGNYFGTDYSGKTVLGLGANSAIKTVGSSAGDVLIGGLGANEGNLIDGCQGTATSGINLASSSNFNIVIQGNKIGSLGAPYSNYNAISLGGSNSNILIEKNSLLNSIRFGIDITSTSNDRIKIIQNSFSNNAGGGINFTSTPPTITSATPTMIKGNGAGIGGIVQVYEWDGLNTAQGTSYLGSDTADASGNWAVPVSIGQGKRIVAINTPTTGNLSTTKFTGAYTVAACPSSVNAGLDQTICATNTSLGVTGTAVSATGVPNWTIINGTGTLLYKDTYNVLYQLSAAERSYTGSTPLKVDLMLTINTATCDPTMSDQMTIYINPKPVVDAGVDQSLCKSASGVTLYGSVTNATGGIWGSSGTGTFSNKNSLSTTYTPSPAEMSIGATIRLFLNSTGNGLCTPVSDSLIVTITPDPKAYASPDQTICASGGQINVYSDASGASGVKWTSNGTGTFANADNFSTTYTPSAADLTNAQIIFTLTTTGNGTCLPGTDQTIINLVPKPKVNAGGDRYICVPISSVTLNGSFSNATGVQWMTNGKGKFKPDSISPVVTYLPSTTESNTTSPISINFTLVTTGNSICPSVTDQMTLTLGPAPAINAGNDRTICAANSNVTIPGSVTGAAAIEWTSSGTGTFVNPNALTTVYTPSIADKDNGSVILTISTVGGNCIASNDMVLTIDPCYIDPNLSFESPTLFKNNGSEPFKHNFAPLNSTGAITYSIKKLSTNGVSSCATIKPDGYVTTSCVDTVLVTAYQAQKKPYKADTASYILYIGKAITYIKLESRGSSVNGPDFRLLAQTNYDQPLTYSIVGGDIDAVSITIDGLITPKLVGTVYIRANAKGSANFQAGYSNDAVVTIYPNLTKPVAINDTLELLIGETQQIDIGKNDYGTTASIHLPQGMVIDIDMENSGVQNKYFRPGVGIFTIDSAGVLTFSAFEAFIGVDSLQYTITDGDGLVSKKANVVLYVKSPQDEIALKANEIITANNDKINDALVIGYTDLSQNNDLLIVDAAGNKLYFTTNYQNNWYATDSHGNELGNGVYYYIFRELNSDGSIKRQLKGNFTVIR